MGSVPVKPNASLVTGTVKRLQRPALGAQQPILELLVRRAEGIEGLANFVAAEEGNTIPINLRGEVREGWPAPQDHVRLRVEFRGDEQGGGYYANAKDLKAVDALGDDEGEG
jgi:hypothetical protein